MKFFADLNNNYIFAQIKKHQGIIILLGKYIKETSDIHFFDEEELPNIKNSLKANFKKDLDDVYKHYLKGKEYGNKQATGRGCFPYLIIFSNNFSSLAFQQTANEELISMLTKKLKNEIFEQDLNSLEVDFKHDIEDIIYIRSIENQYFALLNRNGKKAVEAIKLSADENSATPSLNPFKIP